MSPSPVSNTYHNQQLLPKGLDFNISLKFLPGAAQVQYYRVKQKKNELFSILII